MIHHQLRIYFWFYWGQIGGRIRSYLAIASENSARKKERRNFALFDNWTSLLNKSDRKIIQLTDDKPLLWLIIMTHDVHVVWSSLVTNPRANRERRHHYHSNCHHQTFQSFVVQLGYTQSNLNLNQSLRWLVTQSELTF